MTSGKIDIRQATFESDISIARTLFTEYAESLGFSLCFQNFDRELANLPGDYVPSDGRLLLAFVDDQPAGCIALHRLDENVCEMKRLYVRPGFRGHNLGRKLIDAIFTAARETGYSHMRLDTVTGVMDSAIALYRKYGFKEIAPYCVNPQPGVIYMELDLASVTK